MALQITCAGPCSVYYFSGVDIRGITNKMVLDQLVRIKDGPYQDENKSGSQVLFAVALTRNGQKVLSENGFTEVMDYTSNTPGNITESNSEYTAKDMGIYTDGYGKKVPWSKAIAKFYVLNYEEWLAKHKAEKK